MVLVYLDTSREISQLLRSWNEVRRVPNQAYRN
jgi:hypothetical protein